MDCDILEDDRVPFSVLCAVNNNNKTRVVSDWTGSRRGLTAILLT